MSNYWFLRFPRHNSREINIIDHVSFLATKKIFYFSFNQNGGTQENNGLVETARLTTSEKNLES